ncbi:MAG: hypothetical protein ACRENT_06630, partial [Thermodesulfobacteriota bacterium]
MSVLIFLYISDSKFKRDIPELTEDKRLRLKEEIETFKREIEFESWISSKIVEKTVIHLPQFKDAIE